MATFFRPLRGRRAWFAHDPQRWGEFVSRYRQELAEPGGVAHVAHIASLASAGTVTLVYATKDEAHNNAVALAEIIRSP